MKVEDIKGASTRFLSNNIEDYPEGIILPIDKPYRWTSADVIRKVKYAAIRHFGKKNLKVGHAGTLDPLATGILLVCIGPATRKAEELQRSDKEYVAGVSFGATTPSYDLEKDIDREFPSDGVSEDSVRAVLPSFIGEQNQVAPLFSAKSVDGVRAYETARKLFKQGLSVEDTGILQASRITIYDMELLSFSADVPVSDVITPSGPVSPELLESYQEATQQRAPRINVADISAHILPTAMVRVRCSKGTYIRALSRDLGEALGSGAFLSSLRRTSNGGFSIGEALTLDEVLSMLS